jgi:hypothetical protein
MDEYKEYVRIKPRGIQMRKKAEKKREEELEDDETKDWDYLKAILDKYEWCDSVWRKLEVRAKNKLWDIENHKEAEKKRLQRKNMGDKAYERRQRVIEQEKQERQEREWEKSYYSNPVCRDLGVIDNRSTATDYNVTLGGGDGYEEWDD